jgi:cell division protein FtsN
VRVDLRVFVVTRPRAPRRRADSTSVEGERLPIPSPVSVDSGTLIRGKRDSITSRAPSAAPNQGQRAAAPPAIVPARDSAQRRPPADTGRRVPSAAAPQVTPRAVSPSRYTVQVAAARTRAEADPIAASLVALGFPARVVTSGVWFKVWVGEYPTAAAADSARRAIQARQGGAPFVLRE